MPESQSERTILDFYTYPSVGGDDWRYAFQTAQVRALEMQMLTRATLMDMANASDFASAAASLGASEYALAQGGRDFGAVEVVLQQRRAAVRERFADWMLDQRVVALFKSRDDFANLRLAVRRVVADVPIGTDYSPEGNVPPDTLRQAFEEEDYAALPEYAREAIEQGVLAYYQNKDIRQIDHAIDRVQADYRIRTAEELGSVFLLNLFRIEIDLTNLRTMLRLKFTEAEPRTVLLDGGFVELERFRCGLDLGYESLGPLFFVTPYHRLVEAGAAYVASEQSFLKIEQQCEEHLTGFLKSTVQITAGPQPIIAYLLMKEQEIRMMRLILTAKRNNLEAKVIVERVS